MTAFKHADILIAYAADTSIDIQIKPIGADLWVGANILDVFHGNYENWTFRIKPKMRTVTVNGKEYSWPEPLRSAPEYGTKVWFVTTASIEYFTYRGPDIQFDTGIYHLTKEAAEQHYAAFVAMNLGE
jgi:hypothetical protein